MHPKSTNEGPNLSGLCFCGCGQPTERAPQTHRRDGYVKGQPHRFVKGHNGRRSGYSVEDRGFDTPCWIWCGGLTTEGYADTKIDGRRFRVHIVYWEQEHGPVPSGLELHHRCEQRPCIRPDHLEPLTCAEHRRKHSKLSAEQVADIRALKDTMTQRAIAERFGISQTYVGRIVNGKRWRE